MSSKQKKGNMNTLANYKPDRVELPDDLTQDAWAEIHRNILLCRHASRTWLRQSRQYAEGRWGEDFVAETEVQYELALGLPDPEPKPKLNPEDKSGAIVTIEGISQSFQMWNRKMAPQIESWDQGKLTKALALLAPIEAQAKRIRELLGE
jgi:hypothetical protein